MLATLMGLADRCFAGEVVWMSPPANETERQRVLEASGALAPGLDPLQFRGLPTRIGPHDDEALKVLASTLAAVRAYEQELDGELSVLRELDGPLREVGILRDDADRGILFAATAYQGFAANRFFAQQLATAPEAEPFRARVEGRVVERPWLDAVALDPDREATPYEIAEAPQRVAYNELRERLARAPAATLVPVDWPIDAAWWVDGREQPIPAAPVSVRPGRHLVHVASKGVVVARFDVNAEAAEEVNLVPALGETDWQTFVASVAHGRPVRVPGLDALVEAAGGEVWLVDGPHRWRLTTAELDRKDLPNASAAGGTPKALRPTASASISAGWFNSDDFCSQDADVICEWQTVNALALGGAVDGGVAWRSLRFVAGLDLPTPVGEPHVALTGQASLRPRPIAWAGLGLGPVTVAGGWMFPYHPALGGKLALPVTRFGHAKLELVGAGWIGAPMTRLRADGSEWTSAPAFTTTGGLGVAL